MNFLESLRLLQKLLPKPLDCAGLVSHKKLKLQESLLQSCAFCHTRPLAREESTCRPAPGNVEQAPVKLCCGKGHGHAALNVEGHHPVKEEVVLPLGDDLGLAVLGDENRELLQVGADEVPDAFFRAGFEFEAFLKTAVGLVGGDDEVLFYGTRTLDLLKALLLLIKCPERLQ